MIDELFTKQWGLILGSIALAILFVPKIISGFVQLAYWVAKGNEEPVSEEPDEEMVVVPHKRTEYPHNFDEFIGQNKTIENLKISIHVAKKTGKPIPHTLFYGMPGLGKTTLAEIVSQDFGTQFISVEGITLDSKETIIQVTNQIRENCIVFIDEIHQMSGKLSEVWYKVMENFTIDTIMDEEVHTKHIPRFTTIGATTDFGKLLKPFRDRFIHKYELKPYSIKELKDIIRRLGKVTENVAENTAKISQYTPRLAKGYVHSMEEYRVYGDRPNISEEEFKRLLHLKDIDDNGLTSAQRRVLKVLHNAGNKLGKISLAMAAGISVVDLEELIEPYLVIEGYMSRTPRGREITESGLSLAKRL